MRESSNIRLDFGWQFGYDLAGKAVEGQGKEKAEAEDESDRRRQALRAGLPIQGAWLGRNHGNGAGG